MPDARKAKMEVIDDILGPTRPSRSTSSHCSSTPVAV
jgi:hypothetical protein